MYQAAQFVAHRGYAKHYPENTFTAITAAIRAGAKNVEIDIQFSKDGKPFLYHDVSLQRVSNRNASIFDLTSDELLQLPAYEPERFSEQFIGVPIADGDEFSIMVEVRPFIHFFIELKEESIQQFGREYCLKSLSQLFSQYDNVTLISFDLEACLLAKTEYGFKKTGLVIEDWNNRNQLIHDYQADIIFVDTDLLPEQGELKAVCPIAVYEVDTPEMARQLLQRGIDKIETFAIGELIEALC